MYRNNRLKLKKSGFAMAMMLVAIIVLLVAGVGLLSIGMRSRSFGVYTCSGIAARSAADAGLTKALFEMNEKLKTRPWDDSTLPYATNESLPDSDAVFSYMVTGDKYNGYRVVSFGKYGQIVKQVRCQLALDGPFDIAIYADDLISLKSGSTIDGYNYTSPNETLTIGTNSTLPSTIATRIGVTICGDVFVGTGGDPDIVIDSKYDTVITGITYALDEPLQVPIVAVPQHLVDLPSVGTITTSTTLSGPTKCDNINLEDGKILTIDGPVDLYCNGSFTLDVLSCLVIVDPEINPDAYLNLYLNGDFMVKNSSSVSNTSQDPRKLKIYGLDNCTNVQFLIDSSFFGGIYAPNARVILHNSVEMYGAVIAREYIQQVSADFHYDASLKQGCTSDEMVTFVVKQWYEH